MPFAALFEKAESSMVRRMVLGAAAVAVAGWGCGGGASKAPKDPATGTTSSSSWHSSWETEGSSSKDAAPAVSSEETACKRVLGRVASTGETANKPPLMTHYFDIQLRNAASAARWLVLPVMFPYEGRQDPAPGRGSIDRLSAELLDGRGRAVALVGGGTHGFRAIYLPPGGTTELHDVPVRSAFGSRHNTAKINVIVATEITVDGAAVASLFRNPLVSEGDTEADLDRDPRDQLALARPLGSGSHSVLLSEECTASSTVILKHEDH
jgi:hypothetical protein